MSDPDSPGGRTFAAKLQYLYDNVLPAGRRKAYTDREVAAGIKELGYDISFNYLHTLRSGTKTNPTMRHVEAIAKFFAVPVGYFATDDDAAKVEQELATLVGLRELKEALDDPGIRVLALRARGLSADSLARLGDMIDLVRNLETGHRRDHSAEA
ncbi:XRE family transcriptional regulator [Phytohabitans rumicis]|uniref:XRE family transcriptional regulator n=1 Tax=Phytohabitans rumicis TaxID=1076125 RepID=A0A6V8L7E3_9ACTN|nr:XRE family transcriptional regulator [Phytohabitans rumicis]GFJ93172.1 hypothetical protein Prum_068140 [Phytohabitans rumicis]